MGDVYRARDTRLGRVVAIKVAKERFSERFDREARAIAQLNHPHVCTLHDVGPNYLVMELVEGETLEARLQHGALDTPQVLTFGAQIANGLAAAHAKGIVHRDLKPRNVMITRHGAKVLDFGIATTSDEVTHTATLGIIGTPAYMAPEQRAGGPTDERSDIYALGLILLEMATGQRPDAEQPVVPENRSPQLARSIARCLARDPEDRWQSARDVASVLDLIAHPASAAVGRTAGRGHLPGWALAAGATLAVAAVATAVATTGWFEAAAPRRAIKFSLLPPAGTSFPTVSQAGAPAVSPDGRQIVFVAEGPSGRRLWLRSLDAFDARALAGTDGGSHPAWSPDGRSLVFVADGGLKRVDLEGGEAQLLARGLSGGAAGSATWNAKGLILWSAASRLMTVPAVGGQPAAATERDASQFEENHYAPSFLPDDRRYLFLIRGGVELQFQLVVGELGSTERRVVLSGVTSASYSPPLGDGPGSILFVRDGRLMTQPFDAAAATLAGSPRLVAERVGAHSFGTFGDFSVSPAGVLAFRTAEPGRQELVWFDDTGRVTGTLGDRPGNPRNNLRLSPDGKAVAFTRQDDERQDVWTYELASGVASRLTFGGGRSPVWSQDGSQIAYLHDDTVLRTPATGGGTATVIWKGAGILALNDWSGDGRHMLLTRWDPGLGMNGRGLWLLPDAANESASHEPTLLEPGALHGMFAPAAAEPRWIAYDSAGQTFVRTMPGGTPGKWQVSVDGGNGVRWRRDGRQLFFVGGPTLAFMAADVADGPVFRAGSPRALFIAPPAIRTAISQYAPGYDIAADGRRFLATFPSPESPAEAIHVVINWQSGLAR